MYVIDDGAQRSGAHLELALALHQRAVRVGRLLPSRCLPEPTGGRM
jgi:hypothetical protein